MPPEILDSLKTADPGYIVTACGKCRCLFLVDSAFTDLFKHTNNTYYVYYTTALL
jgi:hypothetical protein